MLRNGVLIVEENPQICMTKNGNDDLEDLFFNLSREQEEKGSCYQSQKEVGVL